MLNLRYLSILTSLLWSKLAKVALLQVTEALNFCPCIPALVLSLASIKDPGYSKPATFCYGAGGKRWIMVDVVM